jgi:hypothetical protein
MKRIRGFAVPAILLVLALFGAIEIEAVHDCANAALVKSVSCK